MLKKAKKPKFSPHVVIHAVVEARKYASRLLSFGTSIRYAEHPNVGETQSLLAIDDILSFSLHARRAIDLLGLKGNFKKLKLIKGRTLEGRDRKPVYESANNKVEAKTTFYDLLGRVIHAKKLGISAIELPTERNIKIGYNSFMGTDSFPQEFWVESDKPGDLMVNIESYVCTYLEKVEPKINDVFWENGIKSPVEKP